MKIWMLCLSLSKRESGSQDSRDKKKESRSQESGIKRERLIKEYTQNVIARYEAISNYTDQLCRSGIVSYLIMTFLFEVIDSMKLILAS
jgi:hypothetical protein